MQKATEFRSLLTHIDRVRRRTSREDILLLAADPIDADVLRLRHESQGEERREDRPGLRRLPSHSITATLQFDSGYAAHAAGRRDLHEDAGGESKGGADHRADDLSADQ